MSIELSPSTEQTPNLTLDIVRDKLAALIRRGFNTINKTTLIEALPASGKSYGVIEWAEETGAPITVFAPRHDLLDEYESWCEEKQLTYQRLPSFYRDCESFDQNDEPINEAASELKQDYEQGLPGASSHTQHQNLPCEENSECTFITKRNVDYQEYDILLGTFRHAYREEWIENRYVAFDEFPGEAFLSTFDKGVASVTSAYLQEKESLPFDNHIDLLSQRNNENVQETIQRWKNDLRTPLFDSKHVRQSSDSSAHAHGPVATLAVIEMNVLENNWGRADLSADRTAVRNPRSTEWTFLQSPDLSGAESVIGLDGTPNTKLWEIALNEQIEAISLLDDSEKQAYLQDVLGLRFRRTTDRWKAVQSGSGVSPPKELALIEGIKQNENRTPALISSKRAINQYKQKGLNELIEKTGHYGKLKGINKFGTERVGIVIGNPHPGDDQIEKWSAIVGESAQRRTVDGEELNGNETDYGKFGNQVMQTFIHDEVLQAAMRFGREESDGTRGATIYFHTSAVPEWVAVEKQIPEIHAWETEKEGMRSVIKAIQSLDNWQSREWKATELYQYTGISDRQVRNCLEKLVEQEYIKNCGKKGQGGALHYSNQCLEDSGWFGHVDFPE